MRPAPKPRYSYRADASVPEFDDHGIVLVMDGDCALCSGAARRIARWDRRGEVRIATALSPLGRGLLEHYALSPDDPTSWLLLENGAARGSLDAMIHLFPRLRRGFAPMKLLRILPPRLQDAIYGVIARNRYRAGRADLCALPDAALQERLIG